MGKAYLGDGCYVDFDGWAIWLTTENGISVTNRIYLEPEVYHALTEYVKRERRKVQTRAALAPDSAPEGGT